MRIAALLAHADDELMCAGTLARFVAEGHDVRLVIGFNSDGDHDTRSCELDASVEAIGCRLVARMLSDEDDFCWSRRWVQEFESYTGTPDLLISHRCEDDNTSHGHFGRIARTIARKNRMQLWEIDQTIPGGLTAHAQPNLFVNVSDYYDQKLGAINAYRSQLDRYPGLAGALFERSRMYGWSIGVGHAEGFTVAKAVWL